MLLPAYGRDTLEHRLEGGELRTAESLAGSGGNTDRAMVLAQYEAAVRECVHLRHVPLVRPDLGESSRPFREIVDGQQLGEILLTGRSAAAFDEAVQSLVPEFIPDRRNEIG